MDDFVGNEVLLTAVIHWVQTLGEAANGVSEESRSSYPDVPWRQVVDMQNLLAHGYRYVDPAIVWQVIVGDLPKLETQIRGILDDLSGKERRSLRVRSCRAHGEWLALEGLFRVVATVPETSPKPNDLTQPDIRRHSLTGTLIREDVG